MALSSNISAQRNWLEPCGSHPWSKSMGQCQISDFFLEFLSMVPTQLFSSSERNEFFGDEVLGKTIKDLVFLVSMQVGVFFAGLNPWDSRWLSWRGSLQNFLDIIDFRIRDWISLIFFHFGDSVIPSNKSHFSVEDEARSMRLRAYWLSPSCSSERLPDMPMPTAMWTSGIDSMYKS